MNDQHKPSMGSTLILAIMSAAIFGCMEGHVLGIFAGAAIGYLLSQVLHLRGLARDLAARLRSLEEPEAKPAMRATTPAPVVVREAAPAVPAAPAASAQAQAPTPPPAPKPAPVLVPPPPQEPSWVDRGVEAVTDWFRRGNPLARAGIVVLFFGGAFLAKYAAEHSHFPVELRFIGIAAVAIGLLIAGWRLRESRPAYAQTLQGGGVAGLYLTIFAATRLYELLPPGFALSLMVVVALASALLAVAQNALALAIIGSTGGFLAPILVSTGSNNHIALFSYYTVLNLAIFTIAWFRAWRMLNLLGFVFTFGIAGAFRALSYHPDKMLSTDFFVILFFLMYVSISVLFSLRQKPDLKGYVSASLVFGLPLAAFGIHASLLSHIEYAVAWSALALGTFYLALATLLHRTRRENLSLLSEAFAALGLIFASLAVPLGFDAQITSATWAVEGAGLLWLGLRQQRRLARAFGALLQVLGGIFCYYGLQTMHAPGLLDPVLNRATMGCLMLAVSGLLSGLWLQRHRETAADHEHGWSTGFGIWGLAWWLIGGGGEIERQLPHHEAAGMVVFLAGSALLLHAGGFFTRWPLPRVFALMLTPMAAMVGFIHAFQSDHPLAGPMVWIWPALLAAHYLMLLREDAIKAGSETARAALHLGTLWLVALLAAWELHWRTQQVLDGVWPLLPWGVAPALLLLPLSSQPPKPAWLTRHHENSYRKIGAGMLALTALVWSFISNLSSNGDPQPLVYLPLLNPLDVSILLALALVAIWWRSLGRDTQASLLPAQPGAMQAFMAGLLFLWINGSLIRALHYLAGAPLDFDRAMESTLVQGALSVLWSLLGFAAIVTGARRLSREIWWTGTAMMAVVVLKLFFVDFSGSTIARIVSSMVVGGLLVVAGYVSPLPPRKEEPAA